MATNKLIRFLAPPAEWRFPVVILVGILVGLFFLIMYVGNATSYLSDNPKACTNCHVPNDNAIRKFLFKASDGLRHSFMFTFRLEPQVIRIKVAGRQVVQENCIRCHSNLLHPISLRSISNKSIYEDTDAVCWDCHREVPHGKVHSLSSTPFAKVD